MRISKKAEYALRAVFAIARTPSTHLHQIHDLSKKENIPIKFLEQILLTLRHGGILTSRRGVHGGYSLAKPASQIAVGEVIRLMDGPLAPVACSQPNAPEPCTCPDPNNCCLRILMTDVRREISAIFDQRSVEDAVQAVRPPLEFQI